MSDQDREFLRLARRTRFFSNTQIRKIQRAGRRGNDNGRSYAQHIDSGILDIIKSTPKGEPRTLPADQQQATPGTAR